MVTGSRVPPRNSAPGYRYRRFLCVPVVLAIFCTSPLRQFYPDAFFPEDNVYENRSLGFLLTFRGNWSIITDPAEMNRTYRAFAKTMQKAGGELLFLGSTVEGLHGVKALAINLNEPPQEYAHYIRDLNKSEVDDDTEPVDFYAGEHPMVKWVYDKAGYRFVEFFFVIDTYDIRVSFWTKPQLFTGFLQVFEEIMSTLTLTAGFN
ncbi:MAG: hypothetical protein JXA18_03105 [Chitinispirillaceae bacterium]|nr:hypothetical protein [Chitinispirillaceae bacterium]